MKSLRQCLAFFAVLFSAAAWADDNSSASGRMEQIRTEVAEAEAAVTALAKKAQAQQATEAELRQAFEQLAKKREAGFAIAYEIAKHDSQSEAALSALTWMMRGMSNRPEFTEALKLLIQHHAASPKLGDALAELAYLLPGPNQPSYGPAMELLQAAARSPDRTVRGHAVLGLAWDSHRKFIVADREKKSEAEALALSAEKAYEALIRDYGDCRYLRTRGARPPMPTLAEEVSSYLYELRHLRQGMPAPEIEAEDLDGAALKLSQMRGKVVLLVFWASWCGPCMAAVPHELELAARFKDRPFALIGVNGDFSKADAAKAVRENGITWKSFWNGSKGPQGPIAGTWNVLGWPTVYVIDNNGIIRHKYLHGQALDEPLEKLIATAESSKP